MKLNKNSLLCYKCKSYIDIENIENLETKWFEYGNYSQKKIKCKECGNWITIKTIGRNGFGRWKDSDCSITVSFG